MQPREVYERRDEFTILDVREWYEWVAGTVAGALHIPIRQVSERLNEIPKAERIVVVCQIGQRSDLVAEFLRQRGYDAHNLEGGLEAWRALELPLTGEQGTLVDGWAQPLPDVESD